MKHLDRITFNPKQCGGRPCIRGMRIRVKDVLDLLAARVPEPEILADYPDLEPEDIQACLDYGFRAQHPVTLTKGLIHPRGASSGSSSPHIATFESAAVRRGEEASANSPEERAVSAEKRQWSGADSARAASACTCSR